MMYQYILLIMLLVSLCSQASIDYIQFTMNLQVDLNIDYILEITMNKDHFSILHFNDVYDIQPEPKEPKAGAAYFKALLDRYRQKNSLTLFSGDAFSPSLLSSQYQGRNMIKPLNSFKIDVACLGNHDLDYDLDHVLQLKGQTNFPWLMSNIFDKKTGKRFADCEQHKIIEKEGLRIGIFSLAQKQWIDTLYPEYAELCQYYPFLDMAEYMINFLKGQKCDIIIALTHMMKYNDMELANKFPEIDLILGGHDHLIVHEVVNNSILVKSGTNFKYFSFLKIFKNQNFPAEEPIQEGKFILKNKQWTVLVDLVEVNHEKMNIVPDEELHHYIEEIYSQFAIRQQRVVLYVKQDLDLTFNTIRKEQSAFLEFMVSIYRHYSRADCAFMNAGNFRMDQIIKAGPVTYGTLTNIIEDTIVVKKVLGKDIVQGLQNCVSMYPNLSGRFSSLSGISFIWDCSKKPYQRVHKESVKINGQPVDNDRIYRVAMHGFMSMGGDGYQCFKNSQLCVTHLQKKNLLLIHDFLSREEHLMKGFEEKYPNRIKIMEVKGEKIMQLNLPPPKNVKMIGE